MADIVSINWKIKLEVDREQIHALVAVCKFWPEMTNHILKNWPEEIDKKKIEKAYGLIHELRRLAGQDKDFIQHLNEFNIT